MSFAFGTRLLWILQWAAKNINFDYFLRIDDDHFLCLERLLQELPWRPKQALYWGFVHCKPGIVRVDEAWLMLTRDLIDEIVGKINTTLPCHPIGDQEMAMWMNNSTYNVTYFMDNTRIVHKTAGHDAKYYTRTVCEEFISLHGVFDTEMKRLWLVWHKLYRAKLSTMPRYKISPIKKFEKLCPFSKVFTVNVFYPEYRFQPQPCKLNPTWAVSKTVYLGREETGERYSSY